MKTTLAVLCVLGVVGCGQEVAEVSINGMTLSHFQMANARYINQVRAKQSAGLYSRNLQGAISAGTNGESSYGLAFGTQGSVYQTSVYNQVGPCTVSKQSNAQAAAYLGQGVATITGGAFPVSVADGEFFTWFPDRLFVGGEKAVKPGKFALPSILSKLPLLGKK